VEILILQSGEAGKSEAGLYFDGFTVDDHGNIRFPILGELNVIGIRLRRLELRSKSNC
jgi:polysaccharide export outer membrane protein